MNVKEAIATAKEYVADIFDAERIQDLGLEEADFDYDAGEWRITLGFSRPWDPEVEPDRLQRAITGVRGRHRSFKVIRISDKDGTVLSIRSREFAA